MKTSKIIMLLVTAAIGMSMLVASANVQVETVEKSVTTLVGTVVDSSSNEAVADAEVTVSDTEESAITDEYGTFTIEILEEGTYTVTVNADGYATAEEEVEITEDGTSVEFVLEPEEK